MYSVIRWPGESRIQKCSLITCINRKNAQMVTQILFLSKQDAKRKAQKLVNVMFCFQQLAQQSCFCFTCLTVPEQTSDQILQCPTVRLCCGIAATDKRHLLPADQNASPPFYPCRKQILCRSTTPAARSPRRSTKTDIQEACAQGHALRQSNQDKTISFLRLVGNQLQTVVQVQEFENP